MSDTNNNTQNANENANQSNVNNSSYESLMKAVNTETAARMRPISEGFSLRSDTNFGNEENKSKQ